MPNQRDVLQLHNRYLDSVVASFDRELAEVLKTAERRTLRRLEASLTLDSHGEIARTPANQRVLRSVDVLFQHEMDNAGYDTLVEAFANQFADAHLPQFQDILRKLSDTMDVPLPEVEFTGRDMDLFASRAISARQQLLGVVDTVAIASKRQALFSVAGLRFTDLVGVLKQQFEKTRSQAVTLADTATTMFYRTVTDTAFRKIEQEFPGVQYVYVGPDDLKTRPFCDDLLARMKTGPLSRKEIDQLDNGQIPNVFLSCGGFNCRHQWIIDTSRLEAKRRAAA